MLVEKGAKKNKQKINLQNRKLVALGPVDEASLRASFPAPLLCNPDGTGRALKNFEFLGAAIGDNAFIQAHTQARAEKAGLLQAFLSWKIPRPGFAFFGRMVYSMRFNPLRLLFHGLWRGT